MIVDLDVGVAEANSALLNKHMGKLVSTTACASMTHAPADVDQQPSPRQPQPKVGYDMPHLGAAKALSFRASSALHKFMPCAQPVEVAGIFLYCSRFFVVICCGKCLCNIGNGFTFSFGTGACYLHV